MRITRAALLFGTLTLVLSACASLNTPPDTRVDDGVKDFIKVEELAEIDVIRRSNDLALYSLSDYYVVAKDRRDNYLIAYRSRCRDIRDQDVTPDVRRDSNTIRAKFDTMRGCRIAAIYSISESQADELISFGKSSGQ